MSQPQIHFRILRLPAQATYITRTDPRFTPSADRYGMPAGSYTYYTRGLDHFYPERNIPYRLGYTTNEAYEFRLVLKLNDICGWSYSQEFAPDDPRLTELLEAARAPDAFMIWQLADETDDPATLTDYLGGSTAGVAYDPAQDQHTYPAPPPGPNQFAQRGGGGLITDATIKITDSGTIQAQIDGTCWAQALAETRQTKLDGKQRADSQPHGIWSLFADALWRNAEYTTDTITSGETELQANQRIITPIGKWLVQATLTQRAAAALTGDTDVYYETAGQHNVLDTFQRLAETSGLIFRTGQPVILLDQPGAATHTWRPQHVHTAEQTYHRPRATSIVTTHTDYARNWTIHSPIEPLHTSYGHIQTSQRSIAPRPETAATAQAYGLEGADGDQEIWRLIAEQVAATAIREAAQYSAIAEMRWQPGSRYGLDWQLGDTAHLNYTASLPNDRTLNPATTIRQATITHTADGTTTITAGLGATSDLVPLTNAEIAAPTPIRLR